MRPKVSDVCIACGTCTAIAPEVFKLGDIKAEVMEADYEANKDKIDDAIAQCPVQAISWE
ncbi:MAG TPA: ferredoxin [Patescibacteria group bacterium]|nr:ferredoxin [Patescibacteria group bacterium]